MAHLYVLALEQGKYYIGRTSSLDNRIDQHFNANGSAWTKKYTPIKLVETIKNVNSYDEDKCTIRYMGIYGIDNVRGGSYCELVLSDETKKLLNKMICTGQDRCFRCRRTGHYASECYSKKYVDGTVINDALAFQAGSPIKKPFPCKFCDKSFETMNGAIHHQNIYCKKKKAVTPGNKPMFACRKCNIKFATLRSARWHENFACNPQKGASLKTSGASAKKRTVIIETPTVIEEYEPVTVETIETVEQAMQKVEQFDLSSELTPNIELSIDIPSSAIIVDQEVGTTDWSNKLTSVSAQSVVEPVAEPVAEPKERGYLDSCIIC
jgi:hypothetical protein